MRQSIRLWVAAPRPALGEGVHQVVGLPLHAPPSGSIRLWVPAPRPALGEGVHQVVGLLHAPPSGCGFLLLGLLWAKASTRWLASPSMRQSIRLWVPAPRPALGEGVHQVVGLPLHAPPSGCGFLLLGLLWAKASTRWLASPSMRQSIRLWVPAPRPALGEGVHQVVGPLHAPPSGCGFLLLGLLWAKASTRWLASPSMRQSIRLWVPAPRPALGEGVHQVVGLPLHAPPSGCGFLLLGLLWAKASTRWLASPSMRQSIRLWVPAPRPALGEGVHQVVGLPLHAPPSGCGFLLLGLLWAKASTRWLASPSMR
eukprot:gene12676-8655_t